jgi:hypothetical protein
MDQMETKPSHEADGNSSAGPHGPVPAMIARPNQRATPREIARVMKEIMECIASSKNPKLDDADEVDDPSIQIDLQSIISRYGTKIDAANRATADASETATPSRPPNLTTSDEKHVRGTRPNTRAQTPSPPPPPPPPASLAVAPSFLPPNEEAGVDCNNGGKAIYKSDNSDSKHQSDDPAVNKPAVSQSGLNRVLASKAAALRAAASALNINITDSARSGVTHRTADVKATASELHGAERMPNRARATRGTGVLEDCWKPSLGPLLNEWTQLGTEAGGLLRMLVRRAKMEQRQDRVRSAQENEHQQRVRQIRVQREFASTTRSVTIVWWLGLDELGPQAFEAHPVHDGMTVSQLQRRLSLQSRFLRRHNPHKAIGIDWNEVELVCPNQPRVVLMPALHLEPHHTCIVIRTVGSDTSGEVLDRVHRFQRASKPNNDNRSKPEPATSTLNPSNYRSDQNPNSRFNSNNNASTSFAASE